MKKLFTIALLACSVNPAFAEGSITGKISWYTVRASDNLHYFSIEGTKSNIPDCARNKYWTIKDENSPAGRTQINLIAAAWMANKTISVTGTGTCTRWGDIEDANTIRVSAP